MGPSGPKVMALIKQQSTRKAVVLFAVLFALPYHDGRRSSRISAKMIANRNPANAPPKWPTKSTLGDNVDIITQLPNMKRNHINNRERLEPKSSHVKSTSAAQTPSKPKPLVEAPTASLKGFATTDNKFPKKPQNKYIKQNFRRPNCFSIPNPMRNWKRMLKKMCNAFACNIMGKNNRQIAPEAIDGPQDAPSKYNEQSFGVPRKLPNINEAK
mmetsp:Transcript_7470/g.21250  ORF Transcript_7470/g.21250 Transcript_7470/m.21250 type:complete len:213 (+) Transcript_7470:105-743(+)